MRQEEIRKCMCRMTAKTEFNTIIKIEPPVRSGIMSDESIEEMIMGNGKWGMGNGGSRMRNGE